MAPRIAIVIYSMYGHISSLAEAAKVGVEKAGGSTGIYQIAETLPAELLSKLGAPPKPDYPTMNVDMLPEFDGFMFGVPTRYGNFPSQWKSFWDSTGGLWTSGALHGKYATQFVSTGSGAGNESTFISCMSTYMHHGMVYVPLGYKNTFTEMTNLEEVHGGSPWGASTFAGPTGQRAVSDLEKKIAIAQGEIFYKALSRNKA